MASERLHTIGLETFLLEQVLTLPYLLYLQVQDRMFSILKPTLQMGNQIRTTPMMQAVAFSLLLVEQEQP